MRKVIDVSRQTVLDFARGRMQPMRGVDEDGLRGWDLLFETVQRVSTGAGGPGKASSFEFSRKVLFVLVINLVVVMAKM